MIDLLPGDIIAVRGDSWVDREIEEVSHAKYSHVALYTGNHSLFEAQYGRKTGQQRLFAYKGRCDVYRYKHIHISQRWEVVASARRYIGTRYALWLIAWEWFRYRFGWALPGLSSEPIICSTFVTDSYDDSHLELCQGIRYPSPGDVTLDKHLEYVGSF